MKDSPSPTGNIVTSLIFFGVTAAIAIILFIDAFVMWLASLTGSVAVAALITGGFFDVIAAVVDLLAIVLNLYFWVVIPELHPGPDRNGLRGRFPDQGWV